MQKRIDRRNNRRNNRWTTVLKIVGYVLLVVLSFFGGKLMYHVVHPHAKTNVQRTVPSHTANSFHSENVPTELQGSYVSYLPMRTPNVRDYYQIASLVHFHKNTVHQQFMIVKKHPQWKIETVVKKKRHQKPQMMKRRVKVPVPLAVQQQMASSHVQGYFKNLSGSAEVGKITSNINTYGMKLENTGDNSEYSQDTLNSYFGDNHPYLVSPADYSHIQLKDMDSDFQYRGYNYHRITTDRAEHLLNNNGSIAPYFDGY